MPDISKIKIDGVEYDVKDAAARETAGQPGEPGKDGTTPHIGDNGHWWVGEADTGVSAQGEPGDDGVTPHIGDNGNWYIGTTDTGVSAKGQDGTSPTVTVSRNAAGTGAVISVVNADGTASKAEVLDGADYVLTETDKAEIAEQAAEQVDTALLTIIGSGEVTV